MTNRERAETLGGGYEIRIVEIEQALNDAEARGRAAEAEESKYRALSLAAKKCEEDGECVCSVFDKLVKERGHMPIRTESKTKEK